MKPRVEFLYSPLEGITRIFVWVGMRIVDKNEKEGVISEEKKKLIRKKVAEQV